MTTSPSALLLLLALSLLVLNGCASYGTGVKQGLTLMEQRHYKAAITDFEKKLSPTGDDRLLLWMETGLLLHLDGQYLLSNQKLDQAEKIAEELYTQRLGDILVTAMSNPRNGVYRGATFERVLINYYKALNYLMLATKEPNRATELLEQAQIEARRVNIILNDVASQQQSYEEHEQDKTKLFSRLTTLMDKLEDRQVITEELVYREDAFIRYMVGVIYELNGSWDDARISYEKAAQLFESGFSKQFGLGEEMGHRAWYDTVRMMQRAGGYQQRINDLTHEKELEPPPRHSAARATEGELVVIHHSGRIPMRQELNLQMRINLYSKELVISPILTGPAVQRQQQLAWFKMLYADRGLFDTLHNYKNEGIVSGAITALDGSFSKTMSLALAWPTVEQLGLDKLLGDFGIRVTVPYYPPATNSQAGTTVLVDQLRHGSMILAHSIRDLALQNQLVDAKGDLNQAMAREIIKISLAGNALKDAGGGMLGGLAAKLITSATSTAETRNWITLPGQIELYRTPLTAGLHSISVINPHSHTQAPTQQVEIRPGAMTVVEGRTF